MRLFFALAGLLLLCGTALADDKALDMQCLREAYPHHVLEWKDDDQGKTWLVLQGGAQVLYDAPDEGGAFDPASPRATVRQSMAQSYPLEPERPTPAAGEHPGRVRSYALLQALYGGSSAEVRKHLKTTELAGQKVLFSAAAGAAEALGRVDFLLRDCLRREPRYRPWVLPLGGTFKWRNIAGENRLSPHSFGIAVDLNPRQGAYWRWSGGTSHPAQQRYPSELVKIFEENGFVWGGKWREYDLMHFEYRPEVICKAKKLRQARAVAKDRMP